VLLRWALLALSATVLTFVLAALVGAPERAERARRERWWREVQANKRTYERATFDPSLEEGPENGKTGARAHANGSYANGAYADVPVERIRAAERKRGRLRRRGRPRRPARHVRRGLAHGAYAPGIRHLLRDASGNGSRRPASRGRFTAGPSRTGVRGR
jgi:hypothetical protein